MTALTDARAAIGGLSKPSKMPGPAYSIPARECKTGGKLRDVPGSVCHNCYALKGRYLFKNVQSAQYRRMDTIGGDAWCANMAMAINGTPYFRWHDSGDLIDLQHLEKITEVCRATPTTKHWLPTREKKTIREYLRQHGAFPANLTVRLSAAMVDGDAPTGLGCTSTVHNKRPAQGYACPAPQQKGQCGDCRACWDRSIDNISYGEH